MPLNYPPKKHQGPRLRLTENPEEEELVKMAKRVGLIQHLPTGSYDGCRKNREYGNSISTKFMKFCSITDCSSDRFTNVGLFTNSSNNNESPSLPLCKEAVQPVLQEFSPIFP